jgi:hypothetical protein
MGTRSPTAHPAEFERQLRKQYESILSAEDDAKLREKCGLGAVINGETARTQPELPEALDEGC